MDNNNELTIEEMLNNMKCVHARLVEKLKTFENRESIIRDLIVSLPEYQQLISSNIALKEEITRLKTVSFDRTEGVQIAITEKKINTTDLCSIHYALNNPFLGDKLLTIVSIWRDKFHQFVDNTNESASNNEALNLLKEDFNMLFSCYLNHIVPSDADSVSDSENVNNFSIATVSSDSMKRSIDVSDEDENDPHNCSDAEEMLDSDTANEFE